MAAISRLASQPSPRVADRLRDIANCFQPETKKCPNLRRYMCGRMLEAADFRSSSWKADPEDNLLQAGMRVASCAGMAVPETLKLEHKWALALLCENVQLEEGYFEFLVHHLDRAVGFMIVQSQM